jgi:type II secretory pathway pseudopilin PulG
MKKKKWFYLIEISFALIIIGIISAGVMVGLRSFFRYHTLEKNCLGPFQRFFPHAFKSHERQLHCQSEFFICRQFEVHIDLNNNRTIDASERRDTVKLPPQSLWSPRQKETEKSPAGTALPSNGTFTSGN